MKDINTIRRAVATMANQRTSEETKQTAMTDMLRQLW